MTNCEKLLESIIKKCTPVIKQLHHITNEINKKKVKDKDKDKCTSTGNEITSNMSINTLSPTMSCTEVLNETAVLRDKYASTAPITPFMKGM